MLLMLSIVLKKFLAGTLESPARSKGERVTEHLGAYLYGLEFEEAKSAYLAHWRAHRSLDTFPSWVAEMIDLHAARTPQERQELALTREQQPPGKIRSFKLPSGTQAVVTAARQADEALDRFIPETRWIAEALHAAVLEARRKWGILPPAPARLPNRLR